MSYTVAYLILPCLAAFFIVRWYLRSTEKEPPTVATTTLHEKYYSMDGAEYSTADCLHPEIGPCWGVCESGFRWGACERCGTTVDMQQYPYNTYK